MSVSDWITIVGIMITIVGTIVTVCSMVQSKRYANESKKSSEIAKEAKEEIISKNNLFNLKKEILPKLEKLDNRITALLTSNTEGIDKNKIYKDFQTFLRKLLEIVAKITDKNIQKEFHQNYLSLNQMSEYIKIGSKNEIRQLKDQTRTLISLISSYSAEIN